MQLLAMISMLVDHIGKIFFQEQLEWRFIGRLAFPIYAYCIVLGFQRTANLKKYLIRLAILAAVSQYPYMIGLKTPGINAVGTLLICLAVLAALERYKIFLQSIIIAAAFIVLEGLPFDYGGYGLLLILIYKHSKGHVMFVSHLLLDLSFILYKGWVYQPFSTFATYGFVYAPSLYSYFERFRVPKWIWRSFYPAHLMALALIA